MKLKRITTVSQPVPATPAKNSVVNSSAKTEPAQKPAIQITGVSETTAQELQPLSDDVQKPAPEKWSLNLPKKETAAPRKTRQAKTSVDTPPASQKTDPVVDRAAKRQKAISQIKEFGKECQGKKEYIKFLQGEPVNRTAAIKAKCYDCCGFFEDGRVDCQDPTCPLYPYFPYSSDKSQAVRKNTGNKNPTWLHNKNKLKEDETDTSGLVAAGVIASAMMDESGSMDAEENEEGAEIDDDGDDND